MIGYDYSTSDKNQPIECDIYIWYSVPDIIYMITLRLRVSILCLISVDPSSKGGGLGFILDRIDRRLDARTTDDAVVYDTCMIRYLGYLLY